jgi:UDP-3-O-[3-hydroxymyristoyl] glucosamine N-acyltransferase
MDLERKYRAGSKAANTLTARELNTLVEGKILDAEGLDFLDGVTTVDSAAAHRLVFLERCTPGLLEHAAAIDCHSMLFVVTPEYESALKQPRVISDSPRSDYTRIVARLFDYDVTYWEQRAAIHPSARIDRSAQISPGVVIGKDSSIGANCLIYPNVVIGPNCRIADHCVVRSSAVIGQPGFGIFRNRAGELTHFPHVGGVVVERCAEIGALTTVCAGSIHPTVIGEFAKVDDHAHIAHNCVIGRHAQVVAGAELGGSVILGDDCWIGPNATVIDGIRIGARSFVGIGSNVLKPVAEDLVVLGNPARGLRKRDEPPA